MTGTISIAMATFNGGRFLRQQLESLAAQTRRPDELVITDDGSTDDTLAIADEFARVAPFPVRIARNGERLGYARNFDRAVSLCTGDVIFLCDQDDFWYPEKLATVEAYFREHPEILVVINDAELVDEALAGSDSPRTQLSQLRALGLPAGREHIIGCCTAFRSAFREILCPLPDGETGHDNWLHALARRLGSRAVIPEILQLYRRHGSSTSKWVGSSADRLGRVDLIRTFWNRDPRPGCERRRRELAVMEERIRAASPGFWTAARLPVTAADLLAGIDRDRAAIERRRRLLHRPRWRRFWPALLMLTGGQYREFQGWKTFMMDSFVYR